MDTQVSQLTRLTQCAHEYFQDHVGAPFEALVAPIDPAMPAGRPVRGSSVYSAIEKARRQDDASVPMGAWEHDMKRADWDKVSAMATDVLRHKSKDLQLTAWLLEAQINKNGFMAIAPCLLLMQTLCERYWDGVYPEAEDGDLEYRANVFRWVNEKLLATLRLVPITATERDRDYCLADLEQARRNEQLREQLRSYSGGRDADALEGATIAQLMAAMTGTPTGAYSCLYEALANALAAIDLLCATIDSRFGHGGQGLGKLMELLEQVLFLVEAELRKRGVHAGSVENEEPASFDAAQAQEEHAVPNESGRATEPGQDADVAHAAGAIRSRADAYARLAEAVDFLRRVEPHSPSPYLVQRAIEWGRMNTADLYEELFLKLGGQLNIFEMLGLQAVPVKGE
jgi:type VI secretion system protein ImpA